MAPQTFSNRGRKTDYVWNATSKLPYLHYIIGGHCGDEPLGRPGPTQAHLTQVDLRKRVAPLGKPLGACLRVAIVTAVSQGDVACRRLPQRLPRRWKRRGGTFGIGDRPLGGTA